MFTETVLPVRPYDYSIYVLRNQAGDEWTINPPWKQTGRLESQIKFRKGLPDGMDMKGLLDRLKELDDISEEKQRLWASMSGYEFGYTHSLAESRKLISMLHQGNQGTDDPRTIIERAGFKFKYDLQRGIVMFEHKKNNKIEVMLSPESIHYVYSTGFRWHNLMRVTVDHMNHDDTLLVRTFWPEACRDPLAIAAQFIVENVEQRLARKGRRFYSPLETG